MINVDTVLHTCGDGYWSIVACAVTINRLDLRCSEDDEDGGELCVYFDTASWDVSTQGLIYTDTRFEAELCDFLNSIGLDGENVSYSEQGMQGDNYVSLDVGSDFIASWRAKSTVDA